MLPSIGSRIGAPAHVQDLMPAQKCSAAWTKTLADKGWANTYLAGDAFTEQLKKDTEATGAILKDIGLVK